MSVQKGVIRQIVVCFSCGAFCFSNNLNVSGTEPATAKGNQSMTFTHVVTADVEYYRAVPQNGEGAAGTIKSGTPIRMLAQLNSFLNSRPKPALWDSFQPLHWRQFWPRCHR